jgi:putative ABC transport system permease protein
MILAALRDLQWRRKRFVIAIFATALVFSMTLVLSGVSESFPREVNSLVSAIGGESYLAASGEAGPFTSTAIVAVEKAPHAAPLMFWSAAVRLRESIKQVGLVGLPAGWPLPVVEGRTSARGGEVVADQSSGLRLGDLLPLGTARYSVVGLMRGRTLFGGQALIVLTIEDAQRRLAGGASITRAFVERTTPVGPPPDGLTRFSRAEASADLERPMQTATRSIAFIEVLLWLVAACIIGSVVFLSALERTRDFAIFKATGVKAWQMGAGLAMQAVILAVLASFLSIGIALLLAPLFPMSVSIPLSASVTLPALAVVIGVVASIAGMRRTATVDPATAFGGR